MIRFTTKALLIATFALFAFVATAPTASADGGTLDVNGNDFAVANFTVSGSQLDVNAASVWDFWGLLFNSGANSFSILSDGTTYTFSGLNFWGIDLWTGGLDFKFKQESTSTTAPEPATILLIGSGLLALALYSSRKALRA